MDGERKPESGQDFEEAQGFASGMQKENRRTETESERANTGLSCVAEKKTHQPPGGLPHGKILPIAWLYRVAAKYW